MSQTSNYQVARVGDCVYVRTVGMASMRTATILDVFLHSEIDQGARTFCIDLSQCQGMDSTYMGLLVGVSKLLATTSGRLVIINPTPSNQRLLSMLGVSAIVPVLEEHTLPKLSFYALNAEAAMTTMQRLETVKRAHEHLMQLNEGNRKAFADFISALDADLTRLRNKG